MVTWSRNNKKLSCTSTHKDELKPKDKISKYLLFIDIASNQAERVLGNGDSIQITARISFVDYLDAILNNLLAFFFRFRNDRGGGGGFTLRRRRVRGRRLIGDFPQVERRGSLFLLLLLQKFNLHKRT